eukprot:1954237-Amphidinium_carterae.1
MVLVVGIVFSGSAAGRFLLECVNRFAAQVLNDDEEDVCCRFRRGTNLPTSTANEGLRRKQFSTRVSCGQLSSEVREQLSGGTPFTYPADQAALSIKAYIKELQAPILDDEK